MIRRLTRYTWTARRIPPGGLGRPFVTSSCRRPFIASSQRRFRRCCAIWPGDTVHTTTVDAGGTDEKGVTRVLGGNPQTGPFYVETAMPGDVLVVTLNRVRLNRDWAISDDALMARALDSELAVKMKDVGKACAGISIATRGVAMPT